MSEGPERPELFDAGTRHLLDAKRRRGLDPCGSGCFPGAEVLRGK